MYYGLILEKLNCLDFTFKSTFLHCLIVSELLWYAKILRFFGMYHSKIDPSRHFENAFFPLHKCFLICSVSELKTSFLLKLFRRQKFFYSWFSEKHLFSFKVILEHFSLCSIPFCTCIFFYKPTFECIKPIWQILLLINDC